MRIFIIGGTGKTGQELIKQALEQGFTVTALARNPASLKIKDPNLSVIKGNVLDTASFEQSIAGHDAVLSGGLGLLKKGFVKFVLV